MFIAGLAAPLFLFLAGLTLSMAASRGRRRSATPRPRPWRAGAACRCSRSRSCSGCSRSCSAGARSVNFLKVDILNVMGIAMIAAALHLEPRRRARDPHRCCLRSRRSAVAMTTPLIREAGISRALPDAIEAYIRPLPGRTNFALFPWAGFLLAGAIAGELVYAARTESQERATAGRPADRRPRRHRARLLRRRSSRRSIRSRTSGPARRRSSSSASASATAMLPIARAIDLFHIARAASRRRLGSRARVIATLGRSSLFVYWIHVEMVYGVIARPLARCCRSKRRWSRPRCCACCSTRSCGGKIAKMQGRELTGPLRILAPILK